MKGSYIKLSTIFSVLWGGILGGLFTRGLPLAMGYILAGGFGAFGAVITVIIGLAIWLFTGPSTFFALNDFMIAQRGQDARNKENQSEEYQSKVTKIKTQTASVAVMALAAVAAWALKGVVFTFLGLPSWGLILLVGAIIAAIIMIGAYIRSWYKDGFNKSDMVLLVGALSVFLGVPAILIWGLPLLAALPLAGSFFVVVGFLMVVCGLIYGMYRLYNYLKGTDNIAAKRYKVAYKQFLEKEKYRLLIEGSTVRGYLERTLQEMHNAGLITDKELESWMGALADPNAKEFVEFGDSEANKTMDSVFETIGLYKPLLGSKYAIASASTVLQTGKEVTNVSIDRLLLPDTGDKKGTLLGKYAKAQKSRWQEVMRKINDVRIRGAVNIIFAAYSKTHDMEIRKEIGTNDSRAYAIQCLCKYLDISEDLFTYALQSGMDEDIVDVDIMVAVTAMWAVIDVRRNYVGSDNSIFMLHKHDDAVRNAYDVSVSIAASIAADIKAREADIKAREADIKAREADIKVREADIEAREADIEARKADIKARKKGIYDGVVDGSYKKFAEMVIDDKYVSQEYATLHSFIKKLRTLKETDEISLPQMETEQGRQDLAKVVAHIEDFGNLSIFSNTPVLRSIASDMYQYHRRLAIDNSDDEYLRAVEEVFADPQWKGSLEAAYKEMINPFSRVKINDVFIEKYISYKARVKTLYLPTISNWFVEQDIELGADSKVEKSSSLEALLAKLQEKGDVTSLALAEKLREKLKVERKKILKRTAQSQSTLDDRRSAVNARYNEIIKAFSDIEGKDSIIQRVLDLNIILDAINRSAVFNGDDGAKNTALGKFRREWAEYESALANFEEKIRLIRDAEGGNLGDAVSAADDARKRLHGAFFNVCNTVRECIDGFNKGQHQYITSTVLPRCGIVLELLKKPLPNIAVAATPQVVLPPPTGPPGQGVLTAQQRRMSVPGSQPQQQHQQERRKSASAVIASPAVGAKQSTPQGAPLPAAAPAVPQQAVVLVAPVQVPIAALQSKKITILNSKGESREFNILSLSYDNSTNAGGIKAKESEANIMRLIETERYGDEILPITGLGNHFYYFQDYPYIVGDCALYSVRRLLHHLGQLGIVDANLWKISTEELRTILDWLVPGVGYKSPREYISSDAIPVLLTALRVPKGLARVFDTKAERKSVIINKVVGNRDTFSLDTYGVSAQEVEGETQTQENLRRQRMIQEIKQQRELLNGPTASADAICAQTIRYINEDIGKIVRLPNDSNYVFVLVDNILDMLGSKYESGDFLIPVDNRVEIIEKLIRNLTGEQFAANTFPNLQSFIGKFETAINIRNASNNYVIEQAKRDKLTTLLATFNLKVDDLRAPFLAETSLQHFNEYVDNFNTYIIDLAAFSVSDASFNADLVNALNIVLTNVNGVLNSEPGTQANALAGLDAALNQLAGLAGVAPDKDVKSIGNQMLGNVGMLVRDIASLGRTVKEFAESTDVAEVRGRSGQRSYTNLQAALAANFTDFADRISRGGKISDDNIKRLLYALVSFLQISATNFRALLSDNTLAVLVAAVNMSLSDVKFNSFLLPLRTIEEAIALRGQDPNKAKNDVISALGELSVAVRAVNVAALQRPELTAQYNACGIVGAQRAAITSVFEAVDIFKASMYELFGVSKYKGYFEDFLKLHGKEGYELRKAGLSGIIQAFSAVLKQVDPFDVEKLIYVLGSKLTPEVFSALISTDETQRKEWLAGVDAMVSAALKESGVASAAIEKLIAAFRINRQEHEAYNLGNTSALLEVPGAEPAAEFDYVYEMTPQSMEDIGDVFESFRTDNLYEINELLKANPDLIELWQNVSQVFSTLYLGNFYGIDVGWHPKIDRLNIQGQKTTQQAENLERMRKVNTMLDAHTAVEIGQSEFSIYAAMKMAQEIDNGATAMNSAMDIPGTELDADGKPINMSAYLYGQAQTSFTGQVQRGAGPFTSFYGKGMIGKLGLATMFTPGEDSAAAFEQQAFYQIGHQIAGTVPYSVYLPFRKLLWARYNTKVLYTEMRYSMNVTRYDYEVFPIIDTGESAGWDRKLINHAFSMHYKSSFFGIIFATIFPILVMFSSFAYLAPFFIAISIVTVLAQSSGVGMLYSNVYNSGDIFTGFFQWVRDVIRGLPFWSNMIPLKSEGIINAANETYEFGGTEKSRKAEETGGGALAKVRYDNAPTAMGKIAYIFGGIFIVVILLMGALTTFGLVPALGGFAGFGKWMIYAAITAILPAIIAAGWIGGKNAYGAFIQKNGTTKSENIGWFYVKAFGMALLSPLYMLMRLIDFLLWLLSFGQNERFYIRNLLQWIDEQSESKLTYSALTANQMFAFFERADEPGYVANPLQQRIAAEFGESIESLKKGLRRSGLYTTEPAKRPWIAAIKEAEDKRDHIIRSTESMHRGASASAAARRDTAIAAAETIRDAAVGEAETRRTEANETLESAKQDYPDGSLQRAYAISENRDAIKQVELNIEIARENFTRIKEKALEDFKRESQNAEQVLTKAKSEANNEYGETIESVEVERKAAMDANADIAVSEILESFSDKKNRTVANLAKLFKVLQYSKQVSDEQRNIVRLYFIEKVLNKVITNFNGTEIDPEFLKLLEGNNLSAVDKYFDIVGFLDDYAVNSKDMSEHRLKRLKEILSKFVDFSNDQQSQTFKAAIANLEEAETLGMKQTVLSGLLGDISNRLSKKSGDKDVNTLRIIVALRNLAFVFMGEGLDELRNELQYGVQIVDKIVALAEALDNLCSRLKEGSAEFERSRRALIAVLKYGKPYIDKMTQTAQERKEQEGKFVARKEKIDSLSSKYSVPRDGKLPTIKAIKKLLSAIPAPSVDDQNTIFPNASLEWYTYGLIKKRIKLLEAERKGNPSVADIINIQDGFFDFGFRADALGWQKLLMGTIVRNALGINNQNTFAYNLLRTPGGNWKGSSTYNVTYIASGGSVNIPKNITGGVQHRQAYTVAPLDPNKLPQKDGWDFDGYVYSVAGTNINIRIDREQAIAGFNISATNAVGNIIITMQWKPKVTVSSGQGTWRTGKDPDAVVVDIGTWGDTIDLHIDDLTAPQGPFEGKQPTSWSRTDSRMLHEPIYEAVTFIPHWNGEGRFDVTYDRNGAETGCPTDHWNGAQLRVPYELSSLKTAENPNGPTREGYKFMGYEVTIQGSDPVTIDSETALNGFVIEGVKVVDHIMIKLLWEPMIIISAGMGTWVRADQNAVIMSLSEFKKLGKVFDILGGQAADISVPEGRDPDEIKWIRSDGLDLDAQVEGPVTFVPQWDYYKYSLEYDADKGGDTVEHVPDDDSKGVIYDHDYRLQGFNDGSWGTRIAGWFANQPVGAQEKASVNHQITWNFENMPEMGNRQENVEGGDVIVDPHIPIGQVTLPDGRKGKIERTIEMRVSGGVRTYDQFFFGIEHVTGDVEITYMFIPQGYGITYNRKCTTGENIDTKGQNIFDDIGVSTDSSPKHGQDYMLQRVDLNNLPTVEGRDDLIFDGFTYTILGSIVDAPISLEEARDGYTIPGRLITGPISINFKWKAKVKINNGGGRWKGLSGGLRSDVDGNIEQGVGTGDEINLDEYAQKLNAPQGCEPKSIYFVNSDGEICHGRVKITRSTTFTAKWIINDQAVTIDPNGAERVIDGETSDDIVLVNARGNGDYTVPAIDASREGYDFDGYDIKIANPNGVPTIISVDAESAKKKYVIKQGLITGAITITLKFAPRVTINLNGGRWIDTVDGETLLRPTKPLSMKEFKDIYGGTTGIAKHLKAPIGLAEGTLHWERQREDEGVERYESGVGADNFSEPVTFTAKYNWSKFLDKILDKLGSLKVLLPTFGILSLVDVILLAVPGLNLAIWVKIILLVILAVLFTTPVLILRYTGHPVKAVIIDILFIIGNIILLNFTSVGALQIMLLVILAALFLIPVYTTKNIVVPKTSHNSLLNSLLRFLPQSFIDKFFLAILGIFYIAAAVVAFSVVPILGKVIIVIIGIILVKALFNEVLKPFFGALLAGAKFVINKIASLAAPLWNKFKQTRFGQSFSNFLGRAAINLNRIRNFIRDISIRGIIVGAVRAVKGLFNLARGVYGFFADRNRNKFGPVPTRKTEDGLDWEFNGYELSIEGFKGKAKDPGVSAAIRDGWVLDESVGVLRKTISRQDAIEGYLIPGQYVKGQIKAKLLWKPQVKIVAGDGAWKKRKEPKPIYVEPGEYLYESNKESVTTVGGREVERKTIIGLSERYRDLLTPPKGYDPESLYFVTAEGTAVKSEIQITKPIVLIAKWKPMVKVRLNLGDGGWKLHGVWGRRNRNAPKEQILRSGVTPEDVDFHESDIEDPSGGNRHPTYWTRDDQPLHSQNLNDPMYGNKNGEIEFTAHWDTQVTWRFIDEAGKDITDLISHSDLTPSVDVGKSIADPEIKDLSVDGNIQLGDRGVGKLVRKVMSGATDITVSFKFGRKFANLQGPIVITYTFTPDYSVDFDTGVAGAVVDTEVQDTPNTGTVNYGQDYIVPVNEPKWILSNTQNTVGIFAGWLIEGTGKTVKSGETILKVQGKLKLVAQWKHEIKINENADGETVTDVPENIEIQHEQPFRFAGRPTRQGWEFAGYIVTYANGEQATFKASDALSIEKVTQNATIMLQWKLKVTLLEEVEQRTVGQFVQSKIMTILVDPGKLVADIINEVASRFRPASDVGTGYKRLREFLIKVVDVALAIQPRAIIHQASSLIMRYILKQYQVSYELNGGTSDTIEHSAARKVTHSRDFTWKSIDAGNIPIRQDWEFDGFDYEINGVKSKDHFTAEQVLTTGFAIPGDQVIGQIKFTLRWKPKVKIVRGDGTIIKEVGVDVGSSLHLGDYVKDLVIPDEFDASTLQWGAGERTVGSADIIKITEPTTIKPAWVLKTYQIKIDPNAGADKVILNGLNNANITHGTKFESSALPTREGYQLYGYEVIGADGSSKEIENLPLGGKIVIDSVLQNATIKLLWKPKVTFVSQLKGSDHLHRDIIFETIIQGVSESLGDVIKRITLPLLTGCRIAMYSLQLGEQYIELHVDNTGSFVEGYIGKRKLDDIREVLLTQITKASTIICTYILQEYSVEIELDRGTLAGNDNPNAIPVKHGGTIRRDQVSGELKWPEIDGTSYGATGQWEYYLPIDGQWHDNFQFGVTRITGMGFKIRPKKIRTYYVEWEYPRGMQGTERLQNGWLVGDSIIANPNIAIEQEINGTKGRIEVSFEGVDGFNFGQALISPIKIKYALVSNRHHVTIENNAGVDVVQRNGLEGKEKSDITDNTQFVIESYDTYPIRTDWEYDGFDLIGSVDNVPIHYNPGSRLDIPNVKQSYRIVLKWKPKVWVERGEGAFENLDGLKTEFSVNGKVNLGLYAARLAKRAGYDKMPIYWKSPQFPDRQFASNEEIVITVPTRFIPHWTPNTYRVMFDGNRPDVVDVESLVFSTPTYRTDFRFPQILEIPRLKFIGWTYTINGEERTINKGGSIPGAEILGDIHLRFNFEAQVTIYPGEGTWREGDQKNPRERYTEGRKITLPGKEDIVPPEGRDPSTLTWKHSGQTYEPGSSVDVGEPWEFTPVWQASEYGVEFLPGVAAAGANMQGAPEDKATFGQGYRGTEFSPVWEGHGEFAGWKIDGTDTIIRKGQPISEIRMSMIKEEKLKLIAQWTHTVRFETGEGAKIEVIAGIKHGTKGSAANIPQAAKWQNEVDGVEFDGWEIVSRNGQDLARFEPYNPDAEITGDMVLRAKWKVGVSLGVQKEQLVGESKLDITGIVEYVAYGTPIGDVVERFAESIRQQTAQLGVGYRHAGNLIQAVRETVARAINPGKTITKVSVLVAQYVLKQYDVTYTFPEGLEGKEKISAKSGEVKHGTKIQDPLIAADINKVVVNGKTGKLVRKITIGGKENDSFQYGVTPVTAPVNIEYEFVVTEHNVGYIFEGMDRPADIRNEPVNDRQPIINPPLLEIGENKTVQIGGNQLVGRITRTVTMEGRDGNISDSFNFGQHGTPVNGNVIITYKFEAYKDLYKATFTQGDASKGEVAGNPVEWEYFGEQSPGDNGTLDRFFAPSPIWPGHRFLGWKEERDGHIVEDAYFNLTTTAIVRNIKLVAMWVSYRAQFYPGIIEVDEQVQNMPDPINAGDNGKVDLSKVQSPTRVGYTFDGWTGWDPAANQYADFNPATTVLPQEITHLAAKWKPMTYEVTSKQPGGVNIQLEHATYHQPYTVPYPPALDGNKFHGMRYRVDAGSWSSIIKAVRDQISYTINSEEVIGSIQIEFFYVVTGTLNLNGGELEGASNSKAQKQTKTVYNGQALDIDQSKIKWQQRDANDTTVFKRTVRADTSETFDIASTLLRDTEIDVEWEHTITFDRGLEDDIVGEIEGIPDGQKVTSGHQKGGYTTPAAPTWTIEGTTVGTFKGWKRLDKLDDPLIGANAQISNIDRGFKLVAVWEHKVTVNLQGGESDGRQEGEQISVEHGKYVQSFPEPTWNDGGETEYAGTWEYSTDGQGWDTFAFGDSGTPVTSDITIRPKVRKNILCEITFDAGAATGKGVQRMPVDKTGRARVKHGTGFSVEFITPAWPKHGVFVGWRDKDTGTLYNKRGQILITKDIHLIAVWSHTVKIVIGRQKPRLLNITSGERVQISLEEEQMIRDESESVQAVGAVKRGIRKFTGWVIAGTTDCFDPNRDTINDNITLIAQFDNFTLAYATNNSTVLFGKTREKSKKPRYIGTIINAMHEAQSTTFMLSNAYIGSTSTTNIGFVRVHTDSEGIIHKDVYYVGSYLPKNGTINHYGGSSYAPLPIVSLNANVLLVPFFVSDCQIPISGHLGLTDTSSQAEIQEFERFLIAKLTVDELYRKTYSSKSLPVVVAAVSPSPLAEAPPPAASVVKAPPPAARRAPVKRGGGPSDEQGFEVVATASSASKTAVAAPPAASGARRALVKRGGSPSDEQALQVGATAARGLGAELLRLGEKSISSASETAVAASRVNVAMQAALAATVDIQTQLQLAIMSKFMSSIKDFQEYQVALMQEAAQAARDGNYFTDGMNLEILDKVAAVLPADLREVFRQNISSKEDASGGVVMSYNSADGKIHINYAMLRAMFFDKEGNIQNTELLEVFVRHEFRHKDYAESSNQVKRAIHAIPSLEEFIISMGDIYDWTRLNPQTEAVQVGYEQAIRFLISEIPYIQAAANIGYETAKSVAATQATYYRTIEDGVIELIAPIYAQDPAMFAKTDDKKSLRLVVVDSADGAQTSAFNQAKILRDNGYSTAVVEHISSITDVAGCYKMPVNVSFTANGTDLVYDVYVRQVDGIHIIGLKLKSDISVELNTSQNFAAAALSFASDVNTNRVLRNSFNALKKDAALMYGVTSNLEINPTGIAMINFVGFPTEFAGVASSHLSTFGGDSPSVISSLAGESETESWVKGALTGVYVATDQEIAESNLTTIDQNIKAEQLYKLDQQEKYYQISVRSSKIDTRFVEKAVWAKKKEGATAIILDVTNDIDLNDSATKERLTLAATTIRALGLRATIKIDVSKLTGNFIDVFNTLFELGFDGISIEAVNVENIETLKSALDALKASSAANAIEARNTMHLKDENIKEQLFAVLETEINNYNTLFITEFDIETGEALIAAQKALEASRRGYERGRRAADTNIVVRAANIRALSSIITRDFSIITAAQLRQAVRTAGVNTEIAKHIGRVLNGVSDDARGTESIIEAVGFVRGIVESCLTNQYMQAFDITQEIFDMNEMSDRESLGVMLTALFVAKPEVFESPASLRTYFDEANSSLINSPNGQMSLLEQRKGVIRFVNSLVEEFELAKQVADKTDQIQTLTISLAIINESMNKISFSRIIEETKKRAKISSATIRNILRAA